MLLRSCASALLLIPSEAVFPAPPTDDSQGGCGHQIYPSRSYLYTCNKSSIPTIIALLLLDFLRIISQSRTCFCRMFEKYIFVGTLPSLLSQMDELGVQLVSRLAANSIFSPSCIHLVSRVV